MRLIMNLKLLGMATIGYLAFKKIPSQGTSPSFNAEGPLTLLGTEKTTYIPFNGQPVKIKVCTVKPPFNEEEDPLNKSRVNCAELERKRDLKDRSCIKKVDFDKPNGILSCKIDGQSVEFLPVKEVYLQ